MNVITEGIKYLSDNINSIGIGGVLAGISGVVVKIIVSWIQNKILQKRRQVEDFRDEVETIKIKLEGQESFSKTLQNHEIRLQVVEKIIDSKVTAFVNDKYEDRRKQNLSVSQERRLRKTELENK